jgi:hypothetical protein
MPQGDESVTGLIYSEYDSKTDELVNDSLTITLFTKKGLAPQKDHHSSPVETTYPCQHLLRD